MGILYNRFTPEYLDGEWTLIKSDTISPLWAEVPIDITGKRELLVICNDMVSINIHILDNDVLLAGGNKKKIYNTNTGTGYGFSVDFNPSTSRLRIDATRYPSISSYARLDSVDIKVYAR